MHSPAPALRSNFSEKLKPFVAIFPNTAKVWVGWYRFGAATRELILNNRGNYKKVTRIGIRKRTIRPTLGGTCYSTF